MHQAATFGQPSATVGGPYDYTRSGNPTRTLLEEQIAQLEARITARTARVLSSMLCMPYRTELSFCHQNPQALIG